MLITPPALALVTSSILVVAFVSYASCMGIRILLQWDRSSASERQLTLERRTYLISTILNHVMAIELVSLFLFVAMVDHFHTFFTGAMCAAGTLEVNPFGYPTLAAKIVSFLLCGIWFVVNHVDNLAFDYPLVRFKYGFLLTICLLILIECVWQLKYLMGLKPQIITSCCSFQFGGQSRGITSQVAHLPAPAAGTVFYGAIALTLASGVRFWISGKNYRLFGILSVVAFPVSLSALISFFSLYFYELPNHHCPFCLLQSEYHFVGYFLYAFLLAGAVAGSGIGIIGLFSEKASLTELIPSVQKRLCCISVLAYGAFALWVTYPVVFSDFKITGY